MVPIISIMCAKWLLAAVAAMGVVLGAVTPRGVRKPFCTMGPAFASASILSIFGLLFSDQLPAQTLSYMCWIAVLVVCASSLAALTADLQLGTVRLTARWRRCPFIPPPLCAPIARRSQKHSFIVGLWAGIFAGLSRFSLFNLLRIICPGTQTAYFVEVWVLGNLFLSVTAVVYVKYFGPSLLWYPILFYGLARVFEITVYQMNVLLFDEYRAKRASRQYAVTGFHRLVVLLIHNYVEIIFWFAACYAILSSNFHIQGQSSLIYTSFIAMTGFGAAKAEPCTTLGLYVLWAQSIVGLLMTMISLARFIKLLPAPKTLDQ